MNNIDVSAIFQFIAQDPETALIMGGILIMVIGIFFLFFGTIGGLIMFIGFLILVLGIVVLIWTRQSG